MTSTPFRDVPYLLQIATEAAERILAELALDGITFGALEDAEAVAADFRDREVETVPAPVADLLSALSAVVAEARSSDGVGAEAVQRLSAALQAARPIAR